MNPSDRDDSGDDFAERLADLDEQLANGHAEPNGADHDDPRLAEAADALRLLEQVRREFPDTPFAVADATPVPADDTVAHEPAVGSTHIPANIGRFEVIREIGAGGYGVVLLAVDPELDRQVALKIPRPEVVVTAELRQRFLREARAAASLSHPNIVSVYEAGNAGPIAYISSAYCDGPSLSAWLKERAEPVPIDRAVELTAQLAEAVQHAHSRGILHRDLKPGNVLLEGRGSRVEGPGPEEEVENPQFTPLVADFGLARIVDEAVGETKTGDIIGTPSYMAPEQAESRHDEIGTAADVYALGAILYELLTGLAPFREDSVLATLEAVRSTEPTAPSRLRPDVPRDLEAVCLKCLEKQPERRYVSAAALAEDLRRFDAGEAVLARPIGGGERAWRWCRRKPLKAALIATIVLSVLSLTAVAGVAYRKVSNANGDLRDERANLERANADLESSRDSERRLRLRAEKHFKGAREAFNELLTPGALFAGVPHVMYLQRYQTQRALQFYRGLLADDPGDPLLRLDVARANIAIGIIHARLNQSKQAEAAFAEGIRLLEAGPPESAAGRLEHARTLAVLHSNLGLVNRPDGAAHRQKARELWQRLLAEYPEDRKVRVGFISSLIVRSEELRKRRDYEAAWKLCRESIDRVQNWSSDETPELIRRSGGLHAQAAAILQHLRRPADALDHARTACRRYESLSATRAADSELTRQLAEALRNFAALAMRQRLPDEAKSACEKAIAVSEAQLQQYPGLASVTQALALQHRTLGQFFHGQRQYTEALPSHRRAVELTGELVERHPSAAYRADAASSLLGLGLALWRLQQFDEAAQALERAVAGSRKLVAEADGNSRYRYQLGTACGVLSNVMIARRDPPADVEKIQRDAVEHLAAAIRIEPDLRIGRRQLTQHLRLLTVTLARQGKHAEAVAALQRVVDRKPPQAAEMIAAAHDAVRGSSAVSRDTRLSDEERDKWQEQYAAAAVRFLEAAVSHSPKIVEGINRDRLLAPLRSRPDFQRLLAEPVLAPRP